MMFVLDIPEVDLPIVGRLSIPRVLVSAGACADARVPYA